ncbi:transposase [Puniceicoccus vermicola]|uniref:Transposase n=1 Tax=Puniceicoccus vermicola TaxID=388746 RepID=A0A7X1E563_9BACT|nr:transposase [Puniceicoccus vermicola]MBC2603320.1 transposase [Puniceicoccus vermicola]
MRRRRQVEQEGANGYYHLMSRTVNGEALFGDREREVLRKMIWQVAEFSGVRVVTYAVMKNHFHLLVEVSGVESAISDKELVRRYQILYPGPTPWQGMSPEVFRSHLAEGTREGQDMRASLIRRMNDVSEMMKTLKQRFSLWYNRSHERFGPLWSDRFKSVLVEGDRWALRTVAAYIDLNAVRAGLVEDPKDYRFCGYGEAIGGGKLARQGLAVIEKDLAGYRQTLYGAGSEERLDKVSISREEALRVLEEEKGKLPLAVVLRCRVRYFTDGMILGSPDFVERQLKHSPDDRKRARKPHAMKGAEWSGLSVGTGLRKNLFG